MPRDTRLSLWPEQMAYYPLISSWADIKKKDAIDFTDCLGVQSCGLTASLLNLHHLFRSNYKGKVKQNIEGKKQLSLFHDIKPISIGLNDKVTTNDVNGDESIKSIIKHKNSKLMQDCINLNFFYYIKDYLDEKFHNEYCQQVNWQPIESSYFLVDTISYPIYKFNFAEYPNDRREPLLNFLEYYVPIFNKISSKYLFKYEQFAAIIYEIAKNSADHTDTDAYMGLDFLVSKTSIKACVLIGDLGPGIYVYVRDALLRETPNRRGKANFSEAYRAALKIGFSTKKDSCKNRGWGMSFTVNNSIALGVHLSIVDAQSRLILSSLDPIVDKEPSHNEIWRISHRMDGKKPFFYYLQYEVPER